jgi:hypothetical protein
MGSRFYITGVQLGMLQSGLWLINHEGQIVTGSKYIKETLDYIEQKQYVGYDLGGTSANVTLVPKAEVKLEPEAFPKQEIRQPQSKSDIQTLAESFLTSGKETTRDNVVAYLTNLGISTRGKSGRKTVFKVLMSIRARQKGFIAHMKRESKKNGTSQHETIPNLTHTGKRKYVKHNPLVWTQDGHKRKQKLELGKNA